MLNPFVNCNSATSARNWGGKEDMRAERGEETGS